MPERSPPPPPRKPPLPRPAYEAVQELFNARCVQCHSCNNAPCQLKLTSYEGLRRGASKIEAIQPVRLKSIPPTRLGIDARTSGEWHKKGFFPVADDKANLLISMINPGPASTPADTVAASRTCPANTGEFKHLAASRPEKLMPFGLPPLASAEREVLAGWVRGGQKPPAAKPAEALAAEQALAKRRWEEFLNGQDLEHKLVARYLYEHMFLASLHFSESSTRYHRIVRSRTACDRPLDEIATRRPSDDPKETFHYCFQPAQETIVEKTLLPYTLDQAKLKRVSGLFFDPGQPWKASHWPDYQSSESTNPFVLYQRHSGKGPLPLPVGRCAVSCCNLHQRAGLLWRRRGKLDRRARLRLLHEPGLRSLWLPIRSSPGKAKICWSCPIRTERLALL